MNITIGSNNGKQLKTLYIASIAGAALALSAVAGLSSSTSTGDTTSVAQPPLRVTRSNLQAERPLPVVLVADSEQQARMDAAIAADEHLVVGLGMGLAERPMVVIKGSSLEQALLSASGDVVGSGRSVSVVDTTLPMNPGTVKASNPQPLFGSAADAEYAAQSLNQLPSPPLSRAVHPMFATEADAEFAAFGWR